MVLHFGQPQPEPHLHLPSLPEQQALTSFLDFGAKELEVDGAALEPHEEEVDWALAPEQPQAIIVRYLLLFVKKKDMP